MEPLNENEYQNINKITDEDKATEFPSSQDNSIKTIHENLNEIPKNGEAKKNIEKIEEKSFLKFWPKKKTLSTETLRKQLKEEEMVFTTNYLLDISPKFDPDQSPKDKFTLGSLYVRSTNQTLIKQGEEWLKELLLESHHETLGPNYKSDCCFLLAWANLRLKEYREARKYAEKLVQINPLNNQAVEIIALIDEELSKEATKGILIGGLTLGAATVTFGLVGFATAAVVMTALKK